MIDLHNQRFSFNFKIIISVCVLYLAYRVAVFIAAGGFDDHIDRLLDSPDILSFLGLLSQQLLKFIGLIIFAVAVYKLRVDIITAIFILFLSVSNFVNLSIFKFYTDSIGGVTELNLKGVLLLIGLVVLYIRDYGWIKSVMKNEIFWPFFIIVFCGLFTQTYNIGFKEGVGIVFVKVIQPMIFMVMISYVARSIEGLRLLFCCSIISLVFFALCRLVLNVGYEDPLTGRIFGIGSWTIYGTLAAGVLPFAYCMWRKTEYLWVKILLIGSSLLMINEVFSTQTRGALAAIPLMGALLLLENKRSKIVFAVIVLSLLSSSLYLGSNIFEYELPDRRVLSISINKNLQEANFVERLERNAEAIEYIARHPISGVGLGKPTSESGTNLAFWVYNPYLHFGVAMGVLAMLAFAFSMFHAVSSMIRNLRYEMQSHKIYQLSIFASLSAWMLNQFTTGDSLLYLQPLESILFFYAVIGMIIGQSIRFDMEKKEAVI